MPSYSSDLRITLIDSGTQAGTWGDTTNATWQYVIDPAISGFQNVSVTSANQALTYVNGATATASLNQAVYASLAFTTTTGAAFNVYAPPNSKQYVLWNNSSYTMTIYNSTAIGNTTAAGVGVSIAAGKKVQVFSDGTNFYTLNINEIFAAYGVLYADATGAVTSSPTLLSFNAAASVFDVASTSNGQAYIRASNSTVNTLAAGAVLAQADKAVANMRAFSSGSSSTLGVNQTLFYGSGTGAGGTVVADFSSGTGSTNQLRFLVGTTTVPITAATINSSGDWDFNTKQLTVGNLAVTSSTVPTDGLYLSSSNVLALSTASTLRGTFSETAIDWGNSLAPYNGIRFLRASNSSTGTGAQARLYAQADVAMASVLSFGSGVTAYSARTYFFGSGTGANGTYIADYSTGTNQLVFQTGTSGSPVTAATVNSSGNWDFNGKDASVGGLAVTGGTTPSNGLYLYAANTLGFSTNTALQAVLSDTSFDYGVAGLAGNRFIRVSNSDTGSSSRAQLYAQSDMAVGQMIAFSSTYTGVYAGKTYIYGRGTGANGTVIGDYSTGTNQLIFQTGTTASPVTAATVNSSGIWTYDQKPSFFTYLSSSQSNVLGTTATTYTVPFDVELFDRTNNVSGGTFTAPVTGIYRFSAQVVVSDLGSAGSASTGIVGKLVTTSQTYTLTYATPTGPAGTNYFGSFQTVGGSVTVSMTAGDTAYIAVQAVGSTGDLADVRGNTSSFYTWFSGELVA